MTQETNSPAPAVFKLAANQLMLHSYAESSYLQYAMAVVSDRALAKVQDGNKPVHRRILFAMKNLGLTHEAKPVKSARIVGEILGRLHPHGDSSVYDALVRLAQPFSLRYPLITGQGNFGSRDGDSSAAMRYTEARLSPVASLLLEELGAGTVDFKPNYDGTYQEPCLLPARLPMILLNGTMGIAVGMASNIPPHNLREVVAATVGLLENPDLSTAEILNFMPGPDFPDGGQLISSPAEIQAAYETGRGSLRIRARWIKEDLARNQWQIVVTELPYGVSTKQVLEQIETLSNPQIPSGKKALSQQQVNLKALALEFLETARDESGKDAPVRLVLVPRTSKIDEDALMAFLLANSSLEDTFGVNNTVIGLSNDPATKGVVAILREWCAFRTETVRRRTRFELEQTEKRIHILEGRLTVFMNVDAVVKVIRDADNPRDDLMLKFGLSEVQADDILEMRLRALNKLEGFKLEKELEALQKEAKRLRVLLASSAALKKLVATEVTEVGKKFGDERRTLIRHESRAAGSTVAARAVVDEPITVIVSKNLWVRARAGHGLDKETTQYKVGDSEGWVLETRSTSPVVFMDNLGRVYSVQASEAPAGRGDGAPLTTLIEIQNGAKIVWAQSCDPETNFLFGGKKGYGFQAKLGQCVASKRAGKAFLTLDAGEMPMPPVALGKAGEGMAGRLIAAGSSDGRLLVFPVDEVKTLVAGGKGVMLMVLSETEELTVMRMLDAGAASVAGQMEVKSKAGTETVAFEIAGDEWPKYQGHRARKGCQMPRKGVWTV